MKKWHQHRQMSLKMFINFDRQILIQCWLLGFFLDYTGYGQHHWHRVIYCFFGKTSFFPNINRIKVTRIARVFHKYKANWSRIKLRNTGDKICIPYGISNSTFRSLSPIFSSDQKNLFLFLIIKDSEEKKDAVNGTWNNNFSKRKNRSVCRHQCHMLNFVKSLVPIVLGLLLLPHFLIHVHTQTHIFSWQSNVRPF